MSPTGARPGAAVIVRGLLVAGLAVGYALLAHYSNAAPGRESLGAVLAVGPLWLAAVGLAWYSAVRVTALLACLALAVLCAARWPLLLAHYGWFYLVQQSGTYGLLALTFGRTLVAGRVPLVTRIATRVHGTLAAPVAHYTRSVTLAWTVFFATLSVVLACLYLLAPLRVWSLFANFCTAPLVALMFVAENLVRRRALPDLEHVGLIGTIRATWPGRGRDAT